MSRTSLHDELVRLRRSYTGENATQARHAIRHAVASFTPQHRSLVVDLLRSGKLDDPDKPQACRSNELQSIRDLVLPDAATVDQQVMESWVWRAASDAVSDLHDRPPASLMRRAHPLHAVCPAPSGCDGLAVRLTTPAALGPLMAALLPRWDDESAPSEVSGMPGLRPHHEGRSVVLRAVDSTAEVRIPEVPLRLWRAALAYVEQAFCGETPENRQRWAWFSSPNSLAAQEREFLDRYPLRPAKARLASALLRRQHLLHSSRYFTTWTLSGVGWHIEYSGGPPPASIMKRYLDPMFGIPGEPRQIRCFEDSTTVDTGDFHQQCRGPRVEVKFRLRRDTSDPVDTEADPDFALPRREAPEWKAFDAAWIEKRAEETVAATRASYTGESPAAAGSGVDMADGGSHGLDSCTPAQRALRAVLAVHTFNYQPVGGLNKLIGSRVYMTTAYTMTISPRAEETVIFTDAPDNLTGYFVQETPGSGMPGMRLEDRPNASTYRLRHLPTGGVLVITGRTEGDMRARGPDVSARGWCGTDHPVTDDEQWAIRAIPPISTDASRLLAALWVRLNLADPHQDWAIGRWDWDPLQRSSPSTRMWDPHRLLWGHDDDWEIHWADIPFARDVVASLVDPAIGLAGIQMRRARDHYVATWGTARLVLRSDTEKFK
jgi:hypothetical protein